MLAGGIFKMLLCPFVLCWLDCVLNGGLLVGSENVQLCTFTRELMKHLASPDEKVFAITWSNGNAKSKIVSPNSFLSPNPYPPCTFSCPLDSPGVKSHHIQGVKDLLGIPNQRRGTSKYVVERPKLIWMEDSSGTFFSRLGQSGRGNERKIFSLLGIFHIKPSISVQNCNIPFVWNFSY